VLFIHNDAYNDHKPPSTFKGWPLKIKGNTLCLYIGDTLDIKHTLMEFFDLYLSSAAKKAIIKQKQNFETLKQKTLFKMQGGFVILNTNDLYTYANANGERDLDEIKDVIFSHL
jgi:hypothetical protein